MFGDIMSTSRWRLLGSKMCSMSKCTDQGGIVTVVEAQGLTIGWWGLSGRI